MSVGDWFVVVMLVLYVGAMVAYCLGGQWGKVVYFVGAAILTVGVLMMKG